MDYEKRYNELESKIKKAYLYAQTDSTKAVLEDILPELAESEDEKIRKEIISALKYSNHKGVYDKHLAWLEKQEPVEEIVERCKKSWYNEGKIAGMAEGLTDEEKYQQGWHDALEKQGEQNSAWSNGYSNGYIQAVEKAVEWLYQRQAVDLEVNDIDKFVNEFKRAMED